MKNLQIKDAEVVGHTNVGILAGIIADGAGTIENCSTGGSVTGTKSGLNP